MTVSHKDLTGTDLHEIKGASTATSGQVPVANGAGGAPFGKLDASSLTGTGNPFGAQLIHVQEQQSSGVAGQSAATVGAYTINVLNTVLKNEIAGASLSANSITLPAGSYFVDAEFPWEYASGTQNHYCAPSISNSATTGLILTGPHAMGYGIERGQWKVRIRGRFTLAAPTPISLRHYKDTGSIGAAAGFSPEIYSDVCIWKVG